MKRLAVLFMFLSLASVARLFFTAPRTSAFASKITRVRHFIRRTVRILPYRLRHQFWLLESRARPST
jgi:hypothetical protein